MSKTEATVVGLTCLAGIFLSLGGIAGGRMGIAILGGLMAIGAVLYGGWREMQVRKEEALIEAMRRDAEARRRVLVVDVPKPAPRPVMVVAVPKPPDSPFKSTEEMEKILERCRRTGKILPEPTVIRTTTITTVTVTREEK